MADMLLHKTNSRRKSTRGVRRIRAHRFPQSGRDGWDQNDFRYIRARTYLSDHFVRIGVVIVALGPWLVADLSLRSAESWPAVAVVLFLAVAGSWPDVYVSAGSLLGSSLVALASVAQLAVAASPVSLAPALQALLVVPVAEVWLVPASPVSLVPHAVLA